jgi:hypothetical protein
MKFSLWVASDGQAAMLVETATTALGPGHSQGAPAVGVASHRLPDAVVACLKARAEVGVQKYGGVLSVGWPKATAGAYQEALDLLVYLHADVEALPIERALARELVLSLAQRLAERGV